MQVTNSRLEKRPVKEHSSRRAPLNSFLRSLTVGLLLQTLWPVSDGGLVLRLAVKSGIWSLARGREGNARDSKAMIRNRFIFPSTDPSDQIT